MIIINNYAKYGAKWSYISKLLDFKSENMVKYRFNYLNKNKIYNNKIKKCEE